MKGRDLALLVVVVGIAGFAASDALRGNDSAPRRAAPPASTETAPQPTPQSTETLRIETIEGLPRGLLGGRLVYSEARTGCTVGEIDLASGTIFPLPSLRSTCAIISAAVTERVAFTLPSMRRDVMPYRVVDLNRPDIDLATFRAFNDSVVWSPDGQRVAWCAPNGQGHELEIGLPERTLPSCAVAYTHGSRPVLRRGALLAAAGGPTYRSPGRVKKAAFAADGSVAILGADGRLALYEPNGARRIVHLPPEVSTTQVSISPSICSLAYVPPGPARLSVAVMPIRHCPGLGRSFAVPGHAVAWSPDGRWLAVAEQGRVALRRADGRGTVIRIGVSAVDLAWKR